MKKIITIIFFFTILIGKAQCPAPTNLTLSVPYPTAVQLSWTENGTATAWEITMIPDFYVGSPGPTSGFISFNNPSLIIGLPPAYGCFAFFVRSACSNLEVSPWVAVGSMGCSTDVYAYLATLSNDSFSINDSFKIYPNPTNNLLNISGNNQIEISSIKIYNLLGQLVQTIINPSYELDVSSLKSGSYILNIVTEKGVGTVKFLKE